MKNLLFIYNPAAGDKSILNALDECVRIFQKSGYHVHLYRMGDDLDEHLAEISNCDRVITAGGDGTVHRTLNAMIRRKLSVPLGIIPAGSANDFANFLKIPAIPGEAAASLMDGEIVSCDIGEVNGSYFINVCAGGMFSNISHHVDAGAKDVLGKFAYYIKGLGQIPGLTPIPLQISAGSETIVLDVYLFLILNSSGAGGFDKLCPVASIMDGEFDFIALKAKPVFELTPLLVHVFTGGLLEDEAVLHLRADKFQITCLSEEDNPLFRETDLDGEKGPDMPLTVFNHKQDFSIILPHLEKANQKGEEHGL